MPVLVHLTPEKYVRRSVRHGIRSERGVYCMPVLPDYYVSHQWLRELKRSGARTILAVYFRVPSDEMVLVGHFGQPHEDVTADEAVRTIRSAPDARGYEIIVPRRIEPGEIVRVRRPRQVIGWRFSPTAKGRPPCGCRFCTRGEIKARKRRDAYEGDEKRPYPALLAELRVLAGADEQTKDGRTAQDIAEGEGETREHLIASRVEEIGSQRAGTAADLLFLLDYPHDDIAESLAIVIGRGRYRDPAARAMLLQLCEHPSDSVREMAAWSLLCATRGGALPALQRLVADPAIAASITDYTGDDGM